MSSTWSVGTGSSVTAGCSAVGVADTGVGDVIAGDIVIGDNVTGPVVGGDTVTGDTGDAGVGTVRRARGTLCSIVLISPEAVEKISSAFSRSLAVAGRPSGSLERQLMTMSDNPCGTSGRTSINAGGSSVRTA